MATEPPTGSPEQGVDYEPNDMFGNQTVMGSRLAFNGLDVPGLMPGQTYYFTFYAENFLYYSEGWTESCTMDLPQARNTGGGAPEVPTEVFLGDSGLTFGCEAWGTLEGQWGRARMWMSLQPDPKDYGFTGEWSDYSDTEHKTCASPWVFDQTGNWSWGIQMDYGSPYGDGFWYLSDNPSWQDMDPLVWGPPPTVTVLPLNDPTNAAGARSLFMPESEIDLTWSPDAQDHDVMVMRKPITGSWIDTEYMQRGFFDVGMTYGDCTVVCMGSVPSCTAAGLDAATWYDFKFYSVNNDFYSPGVEVRASTLGAAPPPGISSSAPPTGDFGMNEGTSQLFEIWAEGSNLTYAWTWDGTAVGGDSSTYTHAAAWGDSGTHTLQCTLSDDFWPNVATSQWNVTIADLPLEIATDSLPSGMVEVPYSAALHATNGVAPYEWIGNPPPMVAWGHDGDGECTVPAALTNVLAIAGGDKYSVALKSDGTVMAWGDSVNGKCNVPPGLADVVAIEAGDRHGVALRSDGTVVPWGNNAFNQTNVPAGLSNVVAIASKGFHTLALKSDGTVVTWGYNYYGQCNQPAGLTGVVAVAAGYYHSLALKSDGTVVAWGGWNGQSNVPAGLTDVASIAGNGYYSLALKSDGTVVAWGSRTNVLAGLTGVVEIAAGYDHSLARKSDDTVVAWGDNGEGQCDVPAGLTGVVAIAGGRNHSLALRSTPPTLPDGLSCSLDGVASGTPTQAGTHIVTFIVRDSVGTTTNKSLEIVIQPNLPVAPVSSPATEVTTTGFSANWSASANATNYFLDVATDGEFTSFVNGYEDLAVGNIMTVSVTGLNPGQTYDYRVRAQNSAGISGNSDTIPVTLAKADQTIDFPAIDGKVATDVVELAATASSGLAVSFAVASGPGSIDGNLLTFSGAGDVLIVASQAGNGSWNPAPDVTNSISVAKAAADITLGGLSQIYDGNPKSATVTTVPAGLAVTTTYAGSGTAPSAIGSYEVVALVAEARYAGGTTGTLDVVSVTNVFVNWLQDDQGQDPEDPDFAPDEDLDGDGETTWEEFLADTDPNASNSCMVLAGNYSIASTSHGTGAIRMEFPASPNRYYQLEYCTDLVTPAVEAVNLGWGIPGMAITNDSTGSWYGVIRVLLQEP
ncbi:MAG: MBG domain-containing protein [Kiritimatiellia bacterium]